MELNDVLKDPELTDDEKNKKMDSIKSNNMFGIELDEKVYGLATTNMLLHGDGNSNVKQGNCFELEDFIEKSHPDVILMNPPFNAIPSTVPNKYKRTNGNVSDASDEKIPKAWTHKDEPTKGLVFVKYLSDIAKKQNWNGTKLAVLVPYSTAIGTSDTLKQFKKSILNESTLEAVFSLPEGIFYPGSASSACCMLFTLNKPHFDHEGNPNHETFFCYCRDDGFKKRKNLGRVEQFNDKGESIWKKKEDSWLNAFFNKKEINRESIQTSVSAEDEWLCEAYMKTDYSKLNQEDFQKMLNDYLGYEIIHGES
ncbi:restriction enzyme alpha subunit [Fructilactobacillus fructivorans]|nr:restriction enzyme alpha subunit [Fructilactobacillus fructivorans]